MVFIFTYQCLQLKYFNVNININIMFKDIRSYANKRSWHFKHRDLVIIYFQNFSVKSLSLYIMCKYDNKDSFFISRSKLNITPSVLH